MRRLMLIIAGLGLAVACAPPTAGQPAGGDGPVRVASVPAQSAPAAARAGEVPAETPAEMPPMAEEAPRGESLINGTYPGPYTRGRADAPVTIEEYADFQ